MRILHRRALLLLSALILSAIIGGCGWADFFHPRSEEAEIPFIPLSELEAEPEAAPEAEIEAEPEAAPEAEPEAEIEAEEGISLPPNAENADSMAQSRGMRMGFEFNRLKLNITGVAAREIFHWNDELGHAQETPIYVLYPGAELSVVAADMVDGSLTESGEPHANWYIYRDEDEDIPLTDGMAALEITPDMGGVGAESTYVLIFRAADDI